MTPPAVRQRVLPDGPWQVAHASDGVWREATVPMPWQAQFADMRNSSGRATTPPDAAIGAEVRHTIHAPDGAVAVMQTHPVTQTKAEVRLAAADVAPWSPEDSALQTLTVDLTRDSTSHHFGLRSIATKDGQILFNGKPFYRRAALDQDYFPVGICAPPSVEFLEDELHRAKALGLNMLGCHIKVPDPHYCEVADRLGMLIRTEIPNVGTLIAASARRMRDGMEGILARDGNHPSSVIWTIINEDGGFVCVRTPRTGRGWPKPSTGSRRWIRRGWWWTTRPAKAISTSRPTSTISTTTVRRRNGGRNGTR